MAWSEVSNITGPAGAPGSDADVTAHEAASDPHPGYATDAEVTSGLAGKANTSHAHGQADVTGLAAALDGKAATAHTHLVVSPPYTLAYAASVTPDATAGNNIKITATGALTINEPTGGVDGQTLVIEVLASGANRVVTLHASIALTTGQAAAYTIVSGKVGLIALRFSALAGNVWVCTSMTQEL